MQAVATTTAQRLSTLAQLYQQGQTSQLMDRTLDKLLAHEAEQARLQLETLDADLATFEQQHRMTSADFFRRYQAGETDDRMDYLEMIVRLRIIWADGGDASHLGCMDTDWAWPDSSIASGARLLFPLSSRQRLKPIPLRYSASSITMRMMSGTMFMA